MGHPVSLIKPRVSSRGSRIVLEAYTVIFDYSVGNVTEHCSIFWERSQNSWNPYSFVVSFGHLLCKRFSHFSRNDCKEFGCKICELRKPLLEPIQDTGFKTRGFDLLFPARGWKQFNKKISNLLFIWFRFTLPRKGMETWLHGILLVYPSLSCFDLLFPARGWKPREEVVQYIMTVCGFDLLFPARGWKQ